jgi:hypothetical protein
LSYLDTYRGQSRPPVVSMNPPTRLSCSRLRALCAIFSRHG